MWIDAIEGSNGLAEAHLVTRQRKAQMLMWYGKGITPFSSQSRQSFITPQANPIAKRTRV